MKSFFAFVSIFLIAVIHGQLTKLGLSLSLLYILFPVVALVNIISGFGFGIGVTLFSVLVANIFVPTLINDPISLVFFVVANLILGIYVEYFRKVQAAKQGNTRSQERGLDLFKKDDQLVAELKERFDRCPYPVWIANPEGKIVWYNLRWYEYTGTSSKILMGWQSVHDPKTLVDTLKNWNESIASELPFDTTLTILGKDQFFRRFLSKMTPFLTKDKKLRLWVCTNTDIESLKLNEDELMKAKKSAEDSNHAKSRLMATTSHDIRTPLSCIIGFSELVLIDAKDGDLTKIQRENIKRVVDASYNLLSLVNGLVSLSAAESGKIKLHKETVNLRTILTYLAGNYEYLAMKKSVKFVTDIKVDGNVSMDTPRIREVIDNLVTNALKHTPAGGTIIMGATGNLKEVTIFVKDTGVGVDKADIERIFVAFEQGNRLVSENGNVGLGLSISRQLVGLHGGKIWVESVKGEGSCFSFTLPYHENLIAAV